MRWFCIYWFGSIHPLVEIINKSETPWLISWSAIDLMIHKVAKAYHSSSKSGRHHYPVESPQHALFCDFAGIEPYSYDYTYYTTMTCKTSLPNLKHFKRISKIVLRFIKKAVT